MTRLTSQLALGIPCLCLLCLELQLLLTQDFMEVSGGSKLWSSTLHGKYFAKMSLQPPSLFFEAGSLYIVLDVLTHMVDQADLELTEFHLLLSP